MCGMKPTKIRKNNLNWQKIFSLMELFPFWSSQNQPKSQTKQQLISWMIMRYAIKVYQNYKWWLLIQIRICRLCSNGFVPPNLIYPARILATCRSIKNSIFFCISSYNYWICHCNSTAFGENGPPTPHQIRHCLGNSWKSIIYEIYEIQRSIITHRYKL